MKEKMVHPGIIDVQELGEGKVTVTQFSEELSYRSTKVRRKTWRKVGSHRPSMKLTFRRRWHVGDEVV